MAITSSNNLRLVKKTIGDVVSELVGLEYYTAFNNKVPFPDGDFFVINIIGQDRQATNIVSYTTESDIFYKHENVIAEIPVQFDFYGKESQNAAMLLEMLSYSTEMIERNITVIYNSHPKQLPFEDAHKSMIERWNIELQIKFNNTFTLIAEKAISATIDINPL